MSKIILYFRHLETVKLTVTYQLLLVKSLREMKCMNLRKNQSTVLMMRYTEPKHLRNTVIQTAGNFCNL